MKKILLLGLALILSFYSIDSNAQTIQNVTITSPILCYGDLANILVEINQTPAPTDVKLVIGYMSGSTFVSYTTTPTFTTNFMNILNLPAGSYTIRLVDSASYYVTTPNGSNSASIYDSYTIATNNPLQLSNTSIVTDVVCNGDTNGSVSITIQGGTPPYQIQFGGGSPTIISGTDSNYTNLIAGSYSVVVSDTNSCGVAGTPPPVVVGEPSELSPGGDVSSDYNGRDIRCFGDSDGEITGSVTGGISPYTYSIDDPLGPYVTNPVFPGLSAGSYTIYYLDANDCPEDTIITLFNPPNLSGTIAISSEVSCFGVCDGELTFHVNSSLVGTSPYTYSIGIAGNAGAFQADSNFPALCGNTTYSITVKDANQCTANANQFLAEPTQLSFSDSLSNYNGFNISCDGLSDGSIHFQNPSGGTPTYTYSIDGSNFGTAMNHTGLPAGSYPLTLKDTNGCTKDYTIDLDPPPPFSITYSIDSTYGPNNTPIRCPDTCDGGVSVAHSGGVPPFSYNLTNYPTYLSQTDTFWTGLCGNINFGSYTLGATDANNCTAASVTITLTEPLAFVYTVDSTPEFCSLGDGTASIFVTQGGTGLYSYLWDDTQFQQTNVATNLPSHQYAVRVTDGNECSFSQFVRVDSADITLSFTSVPPCAGGALGQATANPNGVPPYSYSWTDASGTIISTSQTATGLIPGYYTATVTDANLCEVTDSVEISVESVITVSLDPTVSTTHVSCNGDISPGITVLATGGTGVLTYLYHIPGVPNSTQTTGLYNGLLAGTYDVYAVDANGCEGSVQVVITEPDVIYYTATSSDVSCNSGSDGEVWVNSCTGGTPNPSGYVYTWIPNLGNNSFHNNLPAGTYTVKVTDVNGCISIPDSISVTINEPTQLESTTTIINHSSCAGIQTFANGEAQVTASEGTPGYSYSWTGPSWPTYPFGFSATGTNISLLIPGTYIVEIFDANGCTIKDTAIINPGINPILDLTVQDVSCFGENDGTIIAGAVSGTPPYFFSDDAFANTSWPYGHIFGPTGPTSYLITVIDGEGCKDTASIVINEPPDLVISSLTPQNALCYDSATGQITANVSGGTGSYSYQWSDGQTTNPAVNLPALSGYSVIVTDASGCFKTSAVQPITQPDSISVDFAITHVSCNGGNDGSATAIVSGGTPSYSYSWSGGGSSNLIANVVYTSTITDANGCITSKDFILTEPSPLSIVFYGIDSVHCLGGSDGEASAAPAGGTAPYSFLWDDGYTTDVVTTLDAGFHTLIVTDANLCEVTDSIEILEPSDGIEIDSLIISEITCHGADNASITVLATGGPTPYVYSSSNGSSPQSAIAFLNLSPNEYIMYAEDMRGCIDRDTILIEEPDSLHIDTIIFSPITCHGANDPKIIDIIEDGGTPPYLYSVNGVVSSAYPIFNDSLYPGLFNGAGTYTVEVLDSNNCAAQDIIIIEDPDELDITITPSNWNGYEVQCNGDNSGTANISINGGNGPYLKTVYKDNIQIYNGYSSTIDNLLEPLFGGAGMYTFVITDNNGCTYTDSLLYQEPTAITHSFIADSVTCNGWANGSITWNGYGGVGSATTYSYLWNTGEITYSISNVGIGTYTMTVTDENNCTTDSSISIGNGSVLTSAPGTPQNPTCWNYCDGQASVIVNGGVPNINSSGNTQYNYQWDDQLSQITQTAIGLCVDDATNSQTFTCTITDALGCTTTETIILIQPDTLDVYVLTVEDISCFGDNDGSITVGTTGGNVPMPPNYPIFTWNTGQLSPSPNLNNQSSGTYVVVAQDQNGCMDTTTAVITEPSAIEASIDNITDVQCYGDSTGEISVTVNGGTTNIWNWYTYVWFPNNIGNTSESFDPVTQTGTGTLSDIDTGLYYVIVTDTFGCLIESNSVYVAQPTNPLTIFIDSTDETCNTPGDATVHILGGTPTYTYLWSPGGQTTLTATALIPNTTYTVLVTDVNGCTITDQTHINGYKNIFLPNNNDAIDSTICLGTEIDILVEDQGYEYLWSTGQTTPSITVIPQDFTTIYTLYITDPNCPETYEVEAKFNVIKLDINPVATPNPLVLGDIVTIESSYSYNDFVWTWDNDTETGMSINDYPESSTWYYVEATHNLGCKGVDSVYVVVGPVPYDAISPNGDGKNDEWEILDIASYPTADVQIFNRWGSLIFSSTGENYNNNKWNGEHEGKLLPVGTYYYAINLKDGSELQTGAVTIVR